MKAIFKRELFAYFTSPIGYIFIGVFLLISGISFDQVTLIYRDPTIAYVLSNIMIVMVLLVPILTMRLLAEERNSKTDQILITSPVTVMDIVLGKFFAAAAVLAIAILATFPYLIVIAAHGAPIWGEIFATYLGFFLMGLAFVAMGLFISSLTESQIIAAVISFGVLLIMFMMNRLPSTSSNFVNGLIKYITVTDWYNEFTMGIINPANVVYYLSFSALFLFFTARRIEKRRWN